VKTPNSGVENNFHIIKLFAKYVLVLIENIDRFYDCYSSGDVSNKDDPYQ